MPVTTLTIDSPRQLDEVAAHAARVWQSAGLVIFPTETVYGIGAAVTAGNSDQRLRQVKGRPDAQPFTVHLPDTDAITRYVNPDTQPVLMRLARKTMPGPITIIVEVEPEVIADKWPADIAAQLYHQNTIGLRCPDHPAAAAALRATHAPVVASSANQAGNPPPLDADTATRELGEQVDLIIDGGRCRYAKPSTIVKVAGRSLDMSREGVYDLRYLRKLLRQSIVFVCTGNTCRSPMAEALARHTLAERLGVPADQLESHDWAVASAGAFAMTGSPATPQAEQAVRSMGVEFKPHRSRPLTMEMIQQAEVIFCMTESHRQQVLAMAPDAADKTHLLDPSGDIEDPIGGSLAVYQQCAGRIAAAVNQRLDELGV